MGHMLKRTVTGTVIRDLRTRRGMERAELAERIGRSTSLIKAIEIGQRDPSDVVAHRIAAALSCTVDDFSTPVADHEDPAA
jgi:transcriptional regulator with XRE-family HTH domain